MNKFKFIPGLIMLIIFTASVTYTQQKFTHTVTLTNRYCNSTCSLIDVPGLNNNPLAIISVTPFLVNGMNPNPHPTVAFYADSKKWSIINADGSAIPVGAKFNVEYCESLTPPCNCPASLPPNGNAGGDLNGNYPDPMVQKLNGKPISNTAPKIGQILQWNGNEWMPEDDDAVAPSPTVPKPSVLYFNQTDTVEIEDPNVNTKSIPGLDNQSFTLDQNSLVVFHTVFDAIIFGFPQANATGIKLAVEIVTPANAVVARSSSLGWLTKDNPQTFVSASIATLPKGAYHTKVSIIRQSGGARLFSVKPGFLYPFTNQGGQMIIQIFPD